MPANRDTGSSGDDGAPMTRWERLKYAMVKPDDDADARRVAPDERSAEELQYAIHYADDRERAVGLIAGPVSALISFIVIGSMINRNSNLQTTAAKNYVPASTYHWVLLVFLALAAVILVSAWWRKRMAMAISLALYGVGLFQLGWLGFAVPFVLAGAWYLVRAFRLQQAFKKAEAEEGGTSRSTARTNNGSKPRARANRRYTPPT
ncbi:MAG TPA: hypothetical protein VMP41_16185 [Acidimicrobiales bacterium]|nr:hypothetical protein [Acidimicrobiales bacterium]